MLRRFFTAFALITGLAALGAPAHAVENIGERLELGVQFETCGTAVGQSFKTTASSGFQIEIAVDAGWHIQLRPAQVVTVYYGIDRARD
ncbi:hypothetical protein [Altererythrobacter aquiaggeris]|uniref:hypothetical protein n=1 Tax=Aestuarierythrobacter aquiaggeris TaxID=1898396 RepID=UPI003015E514